mmetsp:Transcript_19259/g.64548  ORF Transcript_19259/g.64548 Transcript_19259/m.64548 type:complete len:219 (-) Transcript_19259:7-663(-)
MASRIAASCTSARGPLRTMTPTRSGASMAAGPRPLVPRPRSDMWTRARTARRRAARSSARLTHCTQSFHPDFGMSRLEACTAHAPGGSGRLSTAILAPMRSARPRDHGERRMPRPCLVRKKSTRWRPGKRWKADQQGRRCCRACGKWRKLRPPALRRFISHTACNGRQPRGPEICTIWASDGRMHGFFGVHSLTKKEDARHGKSARAARRIRRRARHA